MPTTPETLATAGFVIGLVAHDYDTAMNAIDRALLINGTSVYALGWGAVILGHAGQAEQGVEYGERALRLSPLDPGIGHRIHRARHRALHCRNWEGVLAACGKAIQAMPRFRPPLPPGGSPVRARPRRGGHERRPAWARTGARLHGLRLGSGRPAGQAMPKFGFGDTLRQLGLPE